MTRQRFSLAGLRTNLQTESSLSTMNSPIIVSHIEQRAISKLTTYTHNARTHSDSQINQIASSIREFGFVNPILIAPDDTVIAGDARLKAAGRVGMSTVPVIILEHLSDTQRRALVIADNQLALSAGWDEQMLRAELAALKAEEFDVDLIGFSEQELNRLIAEQDLLVEQELQALTAVPPSSQMPVSRPGDLWHLGPHQLLCGDTTSHEALAYVDVICRRWQQLTGKPAVLDGANRTFEATAADRERLVA